MQELICFLEKWQTLMGAFIGGIVGLLAALLVARDARRREERAAAMLLVGDLAEVRNASEVLREMSEKKDMVSEEKARWITAALVKGRPSLSPMFESSMARIISVDKYLAAHLILFKKIFMGAEARLTELAHLLERYKQPGHVMLSKEEMNSQIKLITSGFYNAVEHAACAEYLLDKLIIRRSAPFHRLIRKLKTPNEEKKCIELLRTGEA